MSDMRGTTIRGLQLIALSCSLAACAADTAEPSPDTGKPVTPGPMVLAASKAELQRFDALKGEAEAAEALDAAGVRAAYPVEFRSGLSYDPASAGQLDTIQGSALALNDAELAKLGEQGFVVSTRREFPTFLRGLAEIYSEHLPLYVSADALLESVHSSYDSILLGIEYAVLVPELRALLDGMRERLETIDADPDVKADADLYLAVASGLLSPSKGQPVAGADPAQVTKLVNAAGDAAGLRMVKLFGVEREEDFSQFKPRGHYTDEEMMQRYFRTMIWLGRVDLRLLETLPDGEQVFRPEQYQAMLLLHELVGPDMERWHRIDDAVRTFVGESDYMVVPEVASLVEDLGGIEAAKAASDQEVVDAIVAGGYGKQQIASHLMVNLGVVKTLPLNRSFLLFGQRYVADSHVYSEAVYDRIADRMMPNPLDAAFSALGNNQAFVLEQDEMNRYHELPGALARMRVLVDSHGDEDFWSQNFYNLWMSGLRALSPAEDMAAMDAKGLPEVAQTEAWGRRILNAQLGSYAELRHDTLLYAKQSYTGSPGCEFPDVYVDPYPELFDALVKYAEQGSRIVEIAQLAGESSELATQVTAYFAALRNAASRLGEMARAELAGEPFTEAQMAFINDAVRIEQESVVCASVDVPDGWYADLFFNRDKSLEFDPTIADIHTQPADEGGNIVGKVLHVGTGYPRYMVTTIDTCNGPRAYAGVVYAYHELVTEDFQRLDDGEWAQRFSEGAQRPTEAAFMQPVLAQ